jgi:hypothetical protein
MIFFILLVVGSFYLCGFVLRTGGLGYALTPPGGIYLMIEDEK